MQMAGAVDAAWNRKRLLAVIGTPYGQAWLVRTTGLFCLTLLLIRSHWCVLERVLAVMLAGNELGSLA